MNAGPPEPNQVDAPRAVSVKDLARGRELSSASPAERAASKVTEAPGLRRLIFVCLYRIAPRILDAVSIVEPETVIPWHRAGFRSFWRWKSSRRAGRPSVPPEIRRLIREMTGQSALGRSPHPWRVAQARYRHRPDLLCEVHGAAKTTSLARLENVPPQPCRRDRLNRPLRGSDDLIQVTVRPSNSSTRPQTNSLGRRHTIANRRLDRPAGQRGLRVGAGAGLPRS